MGTSLPSRVAPGCGMLLRGSEAQIGIDLTGCKRFVKITGTVSFTGGTTPAATATYALALGDPAQEPVE